MRTLLYYNIWLTFYWHWFSEFASCPSRRWRVYDFWSARWCSDKSISVRICSEPGLPAYFSSSKKSCIIASFRVFYNPDYAKLFGFFHSELSFGIFKFFGSSKSARLSLLLRFLFSYSLFVCSWSHTYNAEILKWL